MIVVFGSINVDLVFLVPHLPTAGETVIGPGYTVFHGGKGANQAVAAVRSGALTEMVGAVGRDQFAPDALAALRSEKVGVHHVRILDIPTGCAAIGVDSKGGNQIMVASGTNASVQANFLNDDLVSGETILLAQMEVPPAANWAAIERVKAAGGRAILNVAPAGPVPERTLSLLDFLIVNENESGVVARLAGIDDNDPVVCGKEIARRFGTAVIVTLGPRGSVLCRKRETIVTPTPIIEPVDTTGAGDTFCGVFAASLDCGLGISDALKRASLAGALSCLKKGARSGMPTAEEIVLGLSKGEREG